MTRLLRAREDLPALLDAVARTIGESLGYRTVAVNIYRPEWDDFEVTTVYGNEEARAMLLGNARPGDDLVELQWFEPAELPSPAELAFTHYPAVLRAAVGYEHL